MKEALYALAKISNVSADEFFSKIKEENKSKKWSITPVKIDFKEGAISHNADEIAYLIDKIVDYVECESKSAPLNKIEEDIEVVSTMQKWFEGSRKQITTPLDELKKAFIEQEKRLKGAVDALKTAKDNLLLMEYKEREEKIREYIKDALASLKENEGIDIRVDLFDDFVMQKRKAKTSLTQKGEVSATLKKDFNAKLSAVVDPIKKEREAQKLKEQDLAKLAIDMRDIDVTEKPQEAIAKLEALKSKADIAYPNAIDEAVATINANLKIAQANMQAKEENAPKDADDAMLDEIIQMRSKSANSEADLNAMLAKLREAYAKAKLTQTKDKILEIANDAKEKIAKLKAEAIKNDNTERKSEDNSATIVYMIAEDTILAMTKMEIEAKSEAEAKQIFIDRFAELLEYENLITK